MNHKIIYVLPIILQDYLLLRCQSFAQLLFCNRTSLFRRDIRA